MKRSSLLRRTPMRRTTNTLRRTPLNPVSRQRAAVAAPRKAAEAALYAIRACCWMCGRSDVELHGHEILSRAQGGDPVNPDALLCNPCNGWCEDKPILAAWAGWKKSKKPHPVMPCITSGECQPWEHRSMRCREAAA